MDILYGYHQPCHLGQFEFFSRAVSLFEGKGLPGEEDESRTSLLQLLPFGLQGLCGLLPSAFLDPLTSQWSMPPSCGCQAPTHKSNELKPLPTGTLVCYLPVGHLTMGRVGPLGSVTYLGFPGLTSVDLPHHLVEPCGHMLLPLLLEMGLQHCAIPAGLHSCCPQASSQREWPVEKHWCCKAS